jgi:hypothetical protein
MYGVKRTNVKYAEMLKKDGYIKYKIVLKHGEMMIKRRRS